MEDALYPVATLEIANKREQLTQRTLNAWRTFSRQRSLRMEPCPPRRRPHSDCSCSCNAMPILHPSAHQECSCQGSDRQGDHGGHLGGWIVGSVAAGHDPCCFSWQL